MINLESDKRQTILVVDDDSTSLAVSSLMLKTGKHRVVTAMSAMDAISTLRENREIDLVVTDMHMPGMNGLELLKQIKSEFNLPVVVISANDAQNVMFESLTNGASFYFSKPFKLDDVKNIWQYAVAGKRRHAPSNKTLTLVPGKGSSSDGKSANSEELKSASFF